MTAEPEPQAFQPATQPTPPAVDAEAAPAPVAEPVAQAAAEDKPKPRAAADPDRPVGLLRKRGLRFVNGLRNVAWLAGWATPYSADSFLLSQTSNTNHDLEIHVSKRYRQLTTAGKSRGPRPLMVMVQVRGTHDASGAQLYLQCTEVDRPSILDMPTRDVWAAGFGHDKAAAKLLGRLALSKVDPFDAEGKIKPEFADFVTHVDVEHRTYELTAEAKEYTDAARLLADITEASGSVIDSRLGRGQNYVSIAGFVDARSWVPSDGHRREFAALLVRQHADRELDIPVHLTGRMANAYFKHADEGTPVLIEGIARRKVIPRDDDPAAEARHESYIEAVRVAIPEKGRDIRAIPAWWQDIRDRVVAERAAAAAARLGASTEAAAAPAASEAVEVVE
ncbi:MAG TPA: hypothetical protein VF292_03110 [Rhodanobacteraceae bacterium]